MTSTDIKAPCSIEYKATKSSGNRSTDTIYWVVIHDEEAPTAESAASWFANPDSEGSAHLCVDDDICYRTLQNHDIPWGAASSFGANLHGFHIEQAGFAKWNLLAWRKRNRTLMRAAYKTAIHCKLFGIPMEFVDYKGLLIMQHGITTHAEVSKASTIQDPKHASQYSHSDPGLFWPRRRFMNYVRQYYSELNV